MEFSEGTGRQFSLANRWASIIINGIMKPEDITLQEIECTPKGPSPVEPEKAIRQALAGLDLGATVKNGDRVAIAAGSRGIDGLVPVLKTAAAILKELGAAPFIVPAMGSHGNGTAEGQAALLERLGVTEKSVGAPVQSSVETVVVGDVELGGSGGPAHTIPIHMDRLASEADHIVVVNRVKPHTRFGGAIQSGLCKMALIGLGNPAGATEIHRATLRTSFEEIVHRAMPVVVEKTPLAFGLALVENGQRQLATVRAARAGDFAAADAELLALAAEWMPTLPFDEIDLLVVDAMGKDISGTGMDTNVTGRKDGLAAPRIMRILVRDLTPASNGNATGVGLADAITRQLADKVDARATTLNCFTALRPEGARIPAVFANDREALAALLPTTGRQSAGEVRLVRIRSTLSLERILASDALINDIKGKDGVRTSGTPRKISFDSNGTLDTFPSG